MPSTNSDVLFNPFSQLVNITAADGRVGSAPLRMIDQLYLYQASSCIGFGAQVGACIMMLAVILSMTPKTRFKRTTTLVNIAALIVNMIHKLILALYFTTKLASLYTLVTGDLQFVPWTAINLSALGSIFSIFVTALIEAALILQAWAMIKIWPTLWKAFVTALSLALVVTTIAFNIGSVVIQVRPVLGLRDDTESHLWVRQTYLGLITASICWFCFLFNIRLVMHMWTNRTILPSLKGLKAMDVLVITNGVLMFIPVIFSALQYTIISNTFEVGSLTQTSVILVLPLGTLVAQRLANPALFGALATTDSTKEPNLNSFHSNTPSAASKRPLLNRITGHGVHRGPPGQGVQTLIASDHGSGSGSRSEKGPAQQQDEVDRELARIDESGNHDLESGVRVDYRVQRSVEQMSPLSVGAERGGS